MLMGGRAYRNMEERLLANSVLSFEHFLDGDPCWEWIGYRCAKGYGQLSVRVPGKKNPRKRWAHRVAYEEFTGDILPPEVKLDHKCVWAPCINPGHVQKLTKSENVALAHGRRRNERI